MITGNYNMPSLNKYCGFIIPYQVITGNYNQLGIEDDILRIIPYQVITGNYNAHFKSL